MPSEAQMWDVLRPEMVKLKMDPVRVENPALPGTPDVNYIGGWTELKHADRWPPKEGPLQLGHPPTPEQRTFLYRRWTLGGDAWLTLRVGRQWLVFRGLDVYELWSARRASPPDRVELELKAVLNINSAADVARYLQAGRT